MFEKLKFWQQKSKKKRPQKPLFNYKLPSYAYQQQHRAPRYISLWEAVFQPYDFNFFLGLFYIALLIFIATVPGPLFYDIHWRPRIDFNSDGAFTITDVLLWCRWLFFVPGDVMISAFLQFPSFSAFFEIYSGSYGGTGALIMSCIYWWAMGGVNMVLLWGIPIAIQTYLR